ncbi:MAG: hypothetical protein L0Y76_03415, partial [Ignavibacteria bacterium]|nr:hypothetical protein [Ignavibacteria bacterium]
MDTFNVQYCFTMTDGSREVFDLNIDARTIHMIVDIPDNPPFWTKLDYHQCPGCPFLKTERSLCPLSVNLVDAVKRFERIISFEKLHVDVITQERIYSKDTTAHEGLSSMMGLIIASSECPFTDFFKPMARFHLPFAGYEETIFRAISTYLLSLYFKNSKNESVDEMTGLSEIYQSIEELNNSVSKRLRAASKKDSTVNALIHLDVFAKFMAFPIEYNLEKIDF